MRSSLPNLLELDDWQLIEKFRAITSPILEASTFSKEQPTAPLLSLGCCCDNMTCSRRLEQNQQIQEKHIQLTLLAELSNAILLKHETHVQETNFTIKTVQKKCKEKEVELKEILCMIQQMKHEMETLEESRDSLYVSNLKIEKTLSAVAKDLEETHFRARELSMELEEQMQENQKLRSEMMRVRRSTAKVDEWKDKALNLQYELEKSRQSEAANLTKIRTLKESYSELEKEHNHLLIEHQGLTYDRENYETLAWLRDSNEKLREHISYLEFRVSNHSYNAGEENDAIVSILKEVSDENVRLKAEIAEYCELLADTRNEASTLRTKLEDLSFGNFSLDTLNNMYADLEESSGRVDPSFYHSNLNFSEYNGYELHCSSAPSITPYWNKFQDGSIRPLTVPTTPEGSYVARDTMFGELEKYVRKRRRQRRSRNSHYKRNQGSEYSGSLSNDSCTDSSDTRSVYSGENLSESLTSNNTSTKTRYVNGLLSSRIEEAHISPEVHSEKLTHQLVRSEYGEKPEIATYQDNNSGISEVISDNVNDKTERCLEACAQIEIIRDNNNNVGRTKQVKSTLNVNHLHDTSYGLRIGESNFLTEIPKTLDDSTLRDLEPVLEPQSEFCTSNPKLINVRNESETSLLSPKYQDVRLTNMKDLTKTSLSPYLGRKEEKEWGNVGDCPTVRSNFQKKYYIRHRVHSDASTQRPSSHLLGILKENETVRNAPQPLFNTLSEGAQRICLLYQKRNADVKPEMAKKLEWLSTEPGTEWRDAKNRYDKRHPVSPRSLKFTSTRTANDDRSDTRCIQKDVYKSLKNDGKAIMKRSTTLRGAQPLGPQKTPNYTYQKLFIYLSVMFERIRSTKMTHINRTTHKAFDIDELSKVSNSMLSGILDELSSMDKHLGTTSPDDRLKDIELKLLVELLQKILKDSAMLRMTSNDYSVAYYHLLDQKQEAIERARSFDNKLPFGRFCASWNNPFHNTEPLLAINTTSVSGTLASPISRTLEKLNTCTSQLSTLIKNSRNKPSTEPKSWYDHFGIHRSSGYQQSAQIWCRNSSRVNFDL